MRISAIVNTLNEANNIADCLESLDWVDEIVVVDMESEDQTKQLAYKYTKNVYNHKRTGYVEPARNFAIAKATGDWILIVDADERVGKKLAQKLRDIAIEDTVNFARIPRKNLIFGSWMKYTRWWPDYNVRFFKRGMVEWQKEIHSIPITHGTGVNLEAVEEMALTHLHYTSLAEYFGRMDRYTSIQAEGLMKSDYQFHWPDMLLKPLNEFLSRFFAAAGYEDGLHGLALAGLQAFSEFTVYLKVWEKQGFRPYKGLGFKRELVRVLQQLGNDFHYWLLSLKIELTEKITLKFWWRLKRKLR